MEKVFVAQRVAQKLWSAEAKIDETMREAAELLAEVLQAPVDMGVSPTIVDASQAKVMEAMKALSDARTALVAAHGELREAGMRTGIRSRMIYICPTTGEVEAEDQPRLQAV